MGQDDDAPATKGDLRQLKTELRDEFRGELGAMRQHLDTRIDLLRDAMGARTSRLESDVGVLKVDVTQLKADVRELKADVSELKADVSELKADVSELKVDVSELKRDVRRIDEGLGALRVEVRGALADQSTVLRQVLRAVEHGNRQRDARHDVHEARLDRLEGHLGLEPLE